MAAKHRPCRTCGANCRGVHCSTCYHRQRRKPAHKCRQCGAMAPLRYYDAAKRRCFACLALKVSHGVYLCMDCRAPCSALRCRACSDAARASRSAGYCSLCYGMPWRRRRHGCPGCRQPFGPDVAAIELPRLSPIAACEGWAA